MIVDAVVLAAGASSRLGQPKQLLVIDGETLLDRAVRIVSEVCRHVVVVLGSQADLMQSGCVLRGASVVVNANWPEGMGSSIRSGVAALKGFSRGDGVLLMTCDMPSVTAQHLRRLTETSEVTASHYAERRGVPAYFPAASFPALLGLEGEQGARALLEKAHTVELASGDLDIDTVADFERAKYFLRG